MIYLLLNINSIIPEDNLKTKVIIMKKNKNPALETDHKEYFLVQNKN